MFSEWYTLVKNYFSHRISCDAYQSVSPPNQTHGMAVGPCPVQVLSLEERVAKGPYVISDELLRQMRALEGPKSRKGINRNLKY